VRRACQVGFAVASHAEGNVAIDTALFAYERAGASLHRAGIPRLEHFIFAGAEHVARIAGVGAAVVAQPHFLSLPAFRAAPTIPSLRTKPLRWLLDAGVTVAGSSDYPVTGFDPLDGIRSAVSRHVPGLGVREPDQRIDLEEALVLYTRSAARVSGCADTCGTLEVGKRADVVVLSGPPPHRRGSRGCAGGGDVRRGRTGVRSRSCRSGVNTGPWTG
jgi:predicted amidohydrolase YtcJ